MSDRHPPSPTEGPAVTEPVGRTETNLHAAERVEEEAELPDGMLAKGRALCLA